MEGVGGGGGLRGGLGKFMQVQSSNNRMKCNFMIITDTRESLPSVLILTTPVVSIKQGANG